MGHTQQDHQAIKADRARFKALAFQGHQLDIDEKTPILELRQCECGTTLACEVLPHAEIEAAALLDDVTAEAA